MKKTLALLLTLVMIITLCLAFTGSAYAEGVEEVGPAQQIVSGVFAEIVDQIIMPALKSLVYAVVSAILIGTARILGRAAAALLNTTFKKKVAKTAVDYVEQKYKEIHGDDKLNKALEKAEALLAKYHIPFDATEMKTLIEAAVFELNSTFEKYSTKDEVL